MFCANAGIENNNSQELMKSALITFGILNTIFHHHEGDSLGITTGFQSILTTEEGRLHRGGGGKLPAPGMVFVGPEINRIDMIRC
jgi:hypothetical protein